MLEPGSPAAKIAALGILGIVILAGNQFIVQPLLQTYQDNQEKIAHSNDLLQRYRALAEEQPRLAERLSALEAADASNTAYLEGTSDALATADLQDLASEAIEVAGGEVRSTQGLPAVDIEDGPSLRKIAVNLRFSTDIDGLAEALYELEAGVPVLFIDHLQVSATGSRQTMLEATSAQELDIRLDVYGYIRRSE